MTLRGHEIADRVETFVRDTVIPYERDPRTAIQGHGPPDDLVAEMRAKARTAGVLTPHILTDGSNRPSGLAPKNDKRRYIAYARYHSSSAYGRQHGHNDVFASVLTRAA